MVRNRISFIDAQIPNINNFVWQLYLQHRVSVIQNISTFP